MRTSHLPLLRVYRTTEDLDEAEMAEVLGAIPDWLTGSFLRTGPGVFDLKDNFQMNHIFDGYAIVSKFEICSGQVQFYKKFVESDAFARAKILGRPNVCEYGTRGYADPNCGFFARILPNIIPPLTDNCNLATFQMGSRTFVSSETCHFKEVDVKSLKNLEDFDSRSLFGLNTLTCHPVKDENGAIFNIGLSITTGLKYNVIRIPPSTSCHETAAEILNQSKIIASVSSSWNGLMSFNHSFAVTKNYVIIIEQPYVYVMSRIFAAAVTKSSSISDWLEWRSNLTNNFLVIEKSSGKLIKTKFCAVRPFFFLHVINAYEDSKGQVVIDIFTSPNASVLNGMTMDALRSGKFREDDLPQAERFIIPIFHKADLENGTDILADMDTSATAVKLRSKVTLTPEVLSLPGLDMPTVSPHYLTKPYKFFYATGSVTNGIWRNSINKIDTQSHQVLTWQKSKAFYVGEALFVPNPNGQSEDDGVLLSAVVTDGSEIDSIGRDFLLILDARSMEEIGRAYVKCHVPQGVHGTFVWVK